MSGMLQVSLRKPVTRLITPLCRALLGLGVSANMVSAVGGLGTVIAALYFYPRGDFFVGTLVSVFFILFDLLDGTMARLSKSGSSSWGALLDSTLDRVSDASILAGVLLYLINEYDRLSTVVIVALVAGGLVSYVKARAESLDIECNGGFAERAERLIIALLAIGLDGLNVPYVLTVGMWTLALASVYTMVERLLIVYRATKSL
ncbi:MAG: CDP-alcohol phosphatidyltransferase family protein [Actinomycetes bacterium]